MLRGLSSEEYDVVARERILQVLAKAGGAEDDDDFAVIGHRRLPGPLRERHISLEKPHVHKKFPAAFFP